MDGTAAARVGAVGVVAARVGAVGAVAARVGAMGAVAVAGRASSVALGRGSVLSRKVFAAQGHVPAPAPVAGTGRWCWLCQKGGMGKK